MAAVSLNMTMLPAKLKQAGYVSLLRFDGHCPDQYHGYPFCPGAHSALFICSPSYMTHQVGKVGTISMTSQESPDRSTGRLTVSGSAIHE